MKKKLAAIGLISLFALTGCSLQGETTTQGYVPMQGSFEEFTYVHSNGKRLDCLRFDRGITCDWGTNKTVNY